MKDHLDILELAARGNLPERLDSSSTLTISVVQELIDAGLLKAIDASSSDGLAYLEPKITLAGREYLNLHTERIGRNREKIYRPFDITIGLIDIDSAWKEIEKEYDISKKVFEQRIGFVKEQFKREVIFRDVAQAFLLAHCGFNKPAIILAGGIIEELLRLYLEVKNIPPLSNTLDSYIKACEESRLLKNAISRLADSVRQFRNIVHLENERSAKHTISKATAKGAVAGIFTIANDFE